MEMNMPDSPKVTSRVKSSIAFLLLACPLARPPLVAATAYYQPTPYATSQTRGVHILDGWLTNIYFGKEFVRDDRLQVGGWADTYRTYIRFDVTGLPKNVTQAALGLMPYSRGDNSTPVDATVYRVTGGWTPSVTWDTQPSATMLGVMSAPRPNQWWLTTITSVYNDWQNGASQNYGLRIDPRATQNNFNVFRSSRYMDDAHRPMLQLEFTPPVPTPNFKIPLPGNASWLVTTEIGGYDCKGLYDDAHDGANYFSIDFSWRNKDATGSRVYDMPSNGGAIPVLAAAAGRVVATSVTNPIQANGHYVVLDHDTDGNATTGFSTRYLHLKEPPLVALGDDVAQGDPLGWMGNTGSSSGDHLHFGVRYNNSGAAAQAELTYVTLDGWLLKSFQTECASGDYIRYYRSSNRAILTPGQVPSFTASAVVEPWTYQPGLSPGGWATIVGQHLAASTEEWKPKEGQPIATTLGGTTVRINGVPSVLSYVSNTLINLLVPGSISQGNATIVVERDGVASQPVSVAMKRMHPSIYSLPVKEGQGYRWYATAVLPGSAQLVGTRRADSRVVRGIWPGEVVDFYVVGLGRTTGDFPTDRLFSGSFPLADTVEVLVNQTRLTPEYAGLISPGLYIVRVRMPQDLPVQDVPVRIVSGDISSFSEVYLTIERATPQITLDGLSVSPSTVTGGQSATGQVTLSDVAPTGGVEVALTSSNAAVRPPTSVRVSAGQKASTFTISTTTVTATATATITASLNGVQRTATLTLQPTAPANPFRDYTLNIETTVLLNGKQVGSNIVMDALGRDTVGVESTAAGSVSAGIVYQVYLESPTFSGNSVTYGRVITGSFSVLGSSYELVTSGSLSMTASSPTVGSSVTGTLRLSTSSRSFTSDFTGRITASSRK